jgi:hypothetical protein
MGESYENAIAVFRRALAFDDQDPELLNHFPGILRWAGDTAAAREVQERCSTVGYCTNLSRDLEYRAAIFREDPRLLAAGADSLFLPRQALFLISGVPMDPALGLSLTDSFASIQTAPSRTPQLRAQAYLLRSNVALARGQHETSWAFLDSAKSLGGQYPGYRMLTHIVTGVSREGNASEVIPRQSMNGLMALGWWAAVRQPADSAEVVFRELERRPWPDSAMGVAVATGLRGIVALRVGDTSRARDLLTRARSNHKRRAAPNRMILPGAWLALILAQLDAARGDFAVARLHLADVFPHNDYVPFIGDAEELRAKVALALGDTTGAKIALRKVISVWANADAPIQPRVAAARSTLARLENH